jgi:hypothetical protein
MVVFQDQPAIIFKERTSLVDNLGVDWIWMGSIILIVMIRYMFIHQVKLEAFDLWVGFLSCFIIIFSCWYCKRKWKLQHKHKGLVTLVYNEANNTYSLNIEKECFKENIVFIQKDFYGCFRKSELTLNIHGEILYNIIIIFDKETSSKLIKRFEDKVNDCKLTIFN